MLLYLNSEQPLKAGNKIEIPANIVMFQELETAEIDISVGSKAKTYKIILDVVLHDPLIRTNQITFTRQWITGVILTTKRMTVCFGLN